jgi:hypothetical protein
MRPDFIFSHMTFIAQFELRALIEELLAAPDEPARQEVIAAMRFWLRMHCAICGALIDHALRRQGETCCFLCVPPSPPAFAAPPAPAFDEDVPF